MIILRRKQLLHGIHRRGFAATAAAEEEDNTRMPLVDIEQLASLRSKSDLLANYSIAPPISHWPQPLFPRRLSLILRRHQTDLDLTLRIFHHASNYVPDFRHNYLSYHTIIDILARARRFDQLEEMLSRLAESSVKCGEEAFITVIRAYGLAGKSSAALKVFLSIRPRFKVNASVRAFNTVLNAMIQNRKFDVVAILFKNCQTKFGIRPNIFTCNILIKALCKLGDIKGALKMIEEIPHWGMVPNLFTYTTVLSFYCTYGDMDSARKLFEEILERGWLPDATAYTVLIDGYCRLGKIIEASKLMDEMEANKIPPNDITYSVMIESLCKQSNPMKSGQALNLLTEMLEADYIPVPPLCCKVIDALCGNQRVDDACWLWRKMLEQNCMPDNSILSTLIYWLCKESKVKEATSLFWEFKKAFFPSVSTYNTLLSGMFDNGELQEAGKLWDDMLDNRCSPSALTYNLLIQGFCKAGLVKDGIKIFEEMLAKGFPPNKVMYQTLIDELRRRGETPDENFIGLLRLGISGGFLDRDCWDFPVSSSKRNS